MTDSIENTPIPDTPPAKSGAGKDAMRGIAAIKKACIEAGLTSKYAICAHLAAAGGESKWVPVEESCIYSTKVLQSIFSNVSDADAQKYAKWKGSKVEFFGWLYGTRIGNPPAEGNYFGRGFNQLTFSANYKKYGQLVGVDLINNPQLLSGTDDATLDLCAKVLVAYTKDRVKNWNEAQWKPGFHNAVFKAIAPKDPHPETKLAYYEYFLGGKAAEAPSDKDATSTSVNKTPAEIASAPASKKEAYTEDRSGNFDKNGFTDPEGKYPLRDYMNEPDTNRLARGIIEGTHVKFKDSIRKRDIPTANGGSYDQPESAYNTIYPFNKVMETESGHLMEFDDSPDGERINIFHRKGTFVEIDPNGTQVNYIVGDSFHIVERNGNIFINGTCNVTCSGPMNILCQGDANLEVKGQVDAVFHNNVNMGVALDLNVAVGGDYNVLVEGNYNVEVGKTMNQRVIGTMSMESTDALKLKTAKTMSLEGGDTESTAETLMKMSSSIKYETPEAFEIKAKSFKLDIAESTELKSGTFKVESTTGNTELKSSSEINMLSSGNINATGTQIQLNPPTDVTIDSITSLDNLGTSKQPVDFAGNEIQNRDKENILVDTVLNPAGEYNPNTLNKNVIDSVLNDIPLSSDILSQFGGKTPDVYDVNYRGPIEQKTSLAAAGITSKKRLVVPPVEGPYNPPFENLIPPARHTDGIYKYETEEDWNTVAGRKARKAQQSTGDFQHNNKLPDGSQEAYIPSGGKGAGAGLSAEKAAEINGKTDFPASFKLSEHFTLGMLVHSQGHKLEDAVLPGGKSEKAGTATRMYTKQEIVGNLCALAENILEPIYDLLGPCKQQGGNATWIITSGLRNEKTGSDHNKGRAVDFHLYPSRNINELYDLVTKLEKILPYNQLIFEYRDNGKSNWIHCSYSTEGRQGMAFTMINDITVNSSGKPAPGSTGLYKFYT